MGVFSDLIIGLPCRYVASQVQSCSSITQQLLLSQLQGAAKAGLFMYSAAAIKVEDFSLNPLKHSQPSLLQRQNSKVIQCNV